MIVYYLTHPQVVIDPEIPVPDWRLSEEGCRRILSALGRPWLRDLRRIVASRERKSFETAELIGQALAIPVQRRPDMEENDRSATGFLPPPAFEAAADAFFSEPGESWNGWETAVAAQSRIVAAVDRALNGKAADSPVLLVGHGAVGALLKCHVAGRAISRREDQPGGGGNVYAFDPGSRKLLCDWTPLEAFDGVPND